MPSSQGAVISGAAYVQPLMDTMQIEKLVLGLALACVLQLDAGQSIWKSLLDRSVNAKARALKACGMRHAAAGCI